jgi:DNA-binding NtrC family response regulator
VLREVRAISPLTACIILTGKPSQESAIRAVNLGAYGYMKKPFKVDELLATIRSAVESRQNATVEASPDGELGSEIAVSLRDCRACLRNIRSLAQSLEKTDTLDGARRFGEVLLSETTAGIRMLDGVLAKL